jgi:hypothetical protein
MGKLTITRRVKLGEKVSFRDFSKPNTLTSITGQEKKLENKKPHPCREPYKKKSHNQMSY